LRIKEKVLAAHRAGIRRIILPDRNEGDTDEIPDDVRKELTIIPAKLLSDVLSAGCQSEQSAEKANLLGRKRASARRVGATAYRKA